MAQALVEKQERTDGNNQIKNYKNYILQSVNNNGKQSVTNSTEQLIKKNNISQTSDPKKINKILTQESINKILSKLINHGEISEKDGKYYYQGFELNQQQMKQTIQSNFAEKIKELNEKEFIKIKLMLNTQSNNNQIRLNNQQKIAIANNIDNLKNQYQKQQEIIEKKTQQHLDSLYKLNKAQAEQRKEMVQIEFNKNQQLFQQDILAAKDRQLVQGYENLQAQLNGQKLQIDQAKQQQDQHIQNLEARYLANLNEERREEQRQKQQMEQHNQIINLQKDIANRAEQNFQNLINGAKANNKALINANRQNLEVHMAADKKIAEAQIAAAAKQGQQQIAANVKLAKGIIENQIKGDKAIAKGLQQLGANINAVKANFDNMNNKLDELDNNMENIGNKINEPIAIPPAPPGVLPPGCAGSSIPIGCSGSSWIQTPKFRHAININTGQKDIEIYRCNGGGIGGGGHYCASDGGSGLWISLGDFYDNIPGWEEETSVDLFGKPIIKGNNIFRRNNNNLFGRNKNNLFGNKF